MPLAPVATPRYAAVPDAPGVPPMVRLIRTLDVIAILASDAAQLVRAFGPPRWGIFSSFGVPLLTGDSVIAVDYRREYRISDYPVEQGGFGSYNKVQEPYDVRVTIAVSGKSTLTDFGTGGFLGAAIKTPSGADPQSGGTLQAASPTTAQAGGIGGGLPL
jgi:hypothetical protein